MGVVSRPELRDTRDSSTNPAPALTSPQRRWGSQVRRKTEQVVKRIHL